MRAVHRIFLPVSAVGRGRDVWGFAIVADSAEFSACVTELCAREYLGTALTLQTSLGFLLTMLTIRLVPFRRVPHRRTVELFNPRDRPDSGHRQRC